ncbi:hypothetical protein VP14_142 [Vibrio phage VPMCC14]|nr:hypothetical protein VP14_142 [Vibrio phage VPMCC14]
MSIRDKEPVDEVINLTMLVVSAENGEYESEAEINKEFNQLLRQVNSYKRKAVEAFKLQNTCKHEEYSTPQWSLRKNILNYYYYFEKKCKCCGHTESIKLEEWNDRVDSFPEGFEGANKVYYNLNI